MATRAVRITQFTTGQVDEINWKRTDKIEDYLSAAQTLINCEVGTTGLIKKRPGNAYVANVTGQAVFNSVMFEFVDEFGNYYLILLGNDAAYIFDATADPLPVVTHDGFYVITYAGQQVVALDNTLNFHQTLVLPYSASDILLLDYTQDNDSLILTHPSYPPGRIYISSYDPLTFAFEYLDIYPLPAFDFNNINYNAFTVALSVLGSTLTFQFTGVGADPGFNNAWIGGQIIGGGVSALDPIGYAIIQSVSYSGGGGGTVTFTALVQIPFLTSGYSTVGSQYSVRQPAWVNTVDDPFGLGYPAKVLFFQNRLWFGNTRKLPATVFGSKINQPISFDVGTGKNVDAIIYTIGQTNSGGIVWLNGGKQLEVFCQNYEFSCPQNEDVGLTPSTFSIRQQSSYGSSALFKPQNYLNDTYFVAKTGKALINFHFTGVGLSYSSTNISVPSTSLMKNPLNRALQRGSDSSQDNLIYMVNDGDDTITAFQFATEYKLCALTPFTFEEDVQLIDLVTVNNRIYILKYYNLTQTFSIEIFDQTIKMDSSQVFFLESTGVITGLDRFNGYTVQVLYEEQDLGRSLVENGAILVNNPQEIADNVHVGLLYDVEIRPMYPFYSANASPFFKQINRIYVDYYQSLNFYINGTLVPYQTFQEIQSGTELLPKTGTEVFAPVSGYGRFDGDAIVITQSSPYDLQILAIEYQIDMSVI